MTIIEGLVTKDIYPFRNLNKIISCVLSLQTVIGLSQLTGCPRYNNGLSLRGT